MSVVEDTLKKLALTDKNVLVACSGGLDSTVLLEACLALQIRPQIIHINYQLRGEESMQDELFVRQLAQKHDLKLVVETCPKELTKGKGINLQDAARKFRKHVFEAFISEGDNHVVLLAQHQDDQIETFFLQLIRGAGLWGLGGMHPSRKGILRPFLHLSKETLLQYAQQNQLTWREDSSNVQLVYKRNLFRQVLIPYLEKEVPTLKSSILIVQETFRNEQYLIEQRIETLLSAWKQVSEIRFHAWNQLNTEEQIYVCKSMNWPIWIHSRIQQLESAPLSSQINETLIFRTKYGFSWVPNFPFNQIWEFKFKKVGFLPSKFSLNEIFLPGPWDEKRMHFGHANSQTLFQKKGVNGRSKIFKLLKDAGIPEQWRASYPILFIDNEAVWIPQIAVSKSLSVQQTHSEILRIQLSSN